eukprot:5432839-Heterocapsa_arctica.AAC.1
MLFNRSTHVFVWVLWHQRCSGSWCAVDVRMLNDRSCAHTVCSVVAGPSTRANSICHASAVAIAGHTSIINQYVRRLKSSAPK